MTITDRQTFLAAIQAAPGDPVPRLVYADYLDEQGDSDGELVRLVCEVQRSGCKSGPAWERMKQLMTGDDWSATHRIYDAERVYGRLGVPHWIWSGCRAVEYRLGFHSTEGT